MPPVAQALEVNLAILSTALGEEAQEFLLLSSGDLVQYGFDVYRQLSIPALCIGQIKEAAALGCIQNFILVSQGLKSAGVALVQEGIIPHPSYQNLRRYSLYFLI